MTPSNRQKWVAGEIGFDHFVLCHAVFVYVSAGELTLIFRIQIILQEALGRSFTFL